MKCPRCNGDGSVPYHIADDLFDETNCPLCGGSGEIEMTEQEYIQTCNTEQLAECIIGIDYGADDKDTKIAKLVEWLNRPHTFIDY